MIGSNERPSYTTRARHAIRYLAMRRTAVVFGVLLLFIWCGANIPAIVYGTAKVPYPQDYIGDEPSPVSGALHVLESRSLLAFRNDPSVYYGPVFPILAIPAVLVDYGVQRLDGVVHSSVEYRNRLIYNWGGIIVCIRILAVLFSLLALWAFWKSLNEERGAPWVPFVATGILATDYYFFEYAHFFEHWVIVIPMLLVQFSTMLSIRNTPKSKRLWVFHCFAALIAAGVSYISLLSMVMWVPLLLTWLREKRWQLIRRFLYLCLALVIGTGLVILWDPYPFIRLLGFLGVGPLASPAHSGQNPFLGGNFSFIYYGAEVVLNHLSYFVAAAVMAVAVGARRLMNDSFLQAAALVVVFNFLLFAPAQHHEGRYMLPVIVFLLLIFGRILTLYVASNRRYTLLVGAAILLGIIVQTASVGGLVARYAEGPPEAAVLNSVQEDPSPILAIGGDQLAVSLTPTAYLRYAAQSARTGTNLYQALTRVPPPPHTRLFDITYIASSTVSKNTSLLTGYKTILVESDQSFSTVNGYNAIDENIARIWFARDFFPTYTQIKP